jgi:beta-glucanase (GH16 family)
VEWNANSISWYLDGTLFATESICAAERSEFQSGFFILLNLAVGGNWPGSPTAATVFPQQLKVDWVRVWQKN